MLEAKRKELPQVWDESSKQFADECEMCHERPAYNLASVQTIPGSFDTKFFDMRMCAPCSTEYDEFISEMWTDFQPDTSGWNSN